MPSTFSCSACGPSPVNHTLLWISNSSDVLALKISGSKSSSLLLFFAKLGERGTWVLSRLLWYIGHFLGFLSLHDNEKDALSDRSRFLWQEAKRRSIPMRQLFLFNSPTDVFEVRIRGHRYFLQSIPVPPEQIATQGLGVDDKVVFKHMLSSHGLPVPKSYSVRSQEKAEEALRELKVVCVKPQSSSNGRHTYPFVRTSEELTEALKSVKEICALASIEEHLEGNLCRATCIDGKLVGFLESHYPTVTGDGVLSIRELIEQANAHKPERVETIVITPSHEGYIRRRGYTLDEVLPDGTSLPLTYRAGWGQGGSNREYGRAIHPSFIPFFEEAARIANLPVVGFDLIIPNVMEDAGGQRWGFIEANSLPWIDIHNAPLYGEPIDLSSHVWDLWK